MLLKDLNTYIPVIYGKSVELHELRERTLNGQNEEQSNDESEEETNKQEEKEVDDENEDGRWERLEYKYKREAVCFNKAVYKDIKKQKANDTYIFLQDPDLNQRYLTHQEQYIPYPHKDALKEVINAVMKYQEESNMVDYHPNVNDLRGEIKKVVEKEMKKKHPQQPQSEPNTTNNTAEDVKIRNIIHQSLQSYHSLHCKSEKQEQIDAYFSRQLSLQSLDQWGKSNKVSLSRFLWLPVEFVYSQEKEMYEVKGRLFVHLENYPQLSELKEELGKLLTYFAGPLKQTHDYFKSLDYLLMRDYADEGYDDTLEDVKSKVDFSEKIHAIVKIAEMEIQPDCTYSGQWHVEGFSSDNILYTCLYVIEQDENLVNGNLQFKRTPRSDDVPTDSINQEQSAHQYCPDYEYLCHEEKLIPLGSLDIKENLMIIFPNQNIHRVQGIHNTTDKPLKRKIIAFFIVNHVDQPLTVNDVEFTQPIEIIKENRLRDMYERSKNKQTDSQAFNYCEH